MEPIVEIPMSEYNRLVEADTFLNRLYAAGVDNWDGYDFALEEEEE